MRVRRTAVARPSGGRKGGLPPGPHLRPNGRWSLRRPRRDSLLAVESARLRRAQLVQARAPALWAVEAEGAHVGEVVADEPLGGADLLAQRGIGTDEAGPDDRRGPGIVLPETDQPAAVEDGVVRQIVEARHLHRTLLAGGRAPHLRRGQQASAVATQPQG